MATEIQQLSDLISSSVSALLQACKENNTPFPNANEPFCPESEAFRASQAAVDATNVIAAAAIQLAERVMPPHMSLMSIVLGHFKNAALRTALELNVTEILRDAGPQGLHVKDIAKICNVDSNKLSRLLRVLCLNQCYREVTPDVFANTRISSVMDSGKCFKELLKKPEGKHEGTPGYAALVEHLSGDGAKFSSHLLENLKDPKTAFSDEPIHAPFNRVFNVDTPLWVWYETPEQSYRRRRFAIGMHGIAQMQPPDILDDVLDWKALPKGSVVVDVGGGIGTSSVAVARNNEHLKFVVQDFKAVCEEAKMHWSKEYPEVVNSGRLTFTPHDFFTPQPITNASVFILKQILHDWADPYSAKILKALRAAAKPDTKLVIVDNIVAYACHDPTTDCGLDDEYHEAPAPILPNFGAANVMPYVVDLGMMMWLNSQERTIGKLAALLESTGWKLIGTRRHDPPSNFYEPVIAAPI
ncbi:S-adenosyl-L-methionine-dependent methyltransferase [Lyophyllum atratum]|nr:S-adenosyl-L-methionine-dependent methyltransferase [Lyophyllum atratum]